MIVWLCLAPSFAVVQEEDEEKIAGLVRRLGSDDFSAREEAEAELLRMGADAAAPLEKLRRETRDPEIRARLDRILGVLAPLREYERLREDPGTLVLDIAPDGTVRRGEEVVFDPRRKKDRLRALFEDRLRDRKSGEGRAAKFVTLLRFPGSTPFLHLQRVLAAGVRHGGAYRIGYAVTGPGGRIREFVRNDLPADKGLKPAALERRDIRIYLCADSVYERMDQHIGYKERHADRLDRQRKAGKPIGGKVLGWVGFEFKAVETLFLTERHPDEASANRRRYEKLAELAGKMSKAFGDVPLVVDMDRQVPAEHVVGVIRALRERGVERVELAPGPLPRR